jgi:hypothetical protein
MFHNLLTIELPPWMSPDYLERLLVGLTLRRIGEFFAGLVMLASSFGYQAYALPRQAWQNLRDRKVAGIFIAILTTALSYDTSVAWDAMHHDMIGVLSRLPGALIAPVILAQAIWFRLHPVPSPEDDPEPEAEVLALEDTSRFYRDTVALPWGDGYITSVPPPTRSLGPGESITLARVNSTAGGSHQGFFVGGQFFLIPDDPR